MPGRPILNSPARGMRAASRRRSGTGARGRNFDEVLRVIDALQLTAKHKVATPVKWQQGKDVIIAGSVSDEQVKGLSGRLGVATPVHPDRAAAALIA